jgi:hypothetical protein
MPVTFHGDDLNLKTIDWDHILTEHGLEGAATMHGWKTKSHWFIPEEDAKKRVLKAFQLFKDWAAGASRTLATNALGRSAVDLDVGEYIGTGNDGKHTSWVRLVLEIKISGNSHLVTAFPL